MGGGVGEGIALVAFRESLYSWKRRPAEIYSRLYCERVIIIRARPEAFLRDAREIISNDAHLREFRGA